MSEPTNDRLTRIRELVDRGHVTGHDVRWLLAELDRVTAERDRLFGWAVWLETRILGAAKQDLGVEKAVEVLGDDRWSPVGELRGVLAEHDRNQGENQGG